MVRHTIYVWAAAVTLAWGSEQCYAGVWTLEPTFSASAEYATNPLLNDAPDSGSAVIANLGLTTHWDDGAVQLSATPQVRLGEATGSSPIGSNAYYVAALGDVRRERSEWSASYKWADDSSALREPQSGTLVRTNIRERTADAALKWVKSITERTQTTVAVNGQSLDYAASANTGLISYQYGTATADVSRDVSERTQVRVAAVLSRYQLPGSSYREDNTGLQVGVSGRMSPIWSYKLSLGTSRLSASTTTTRPSGANYAATLDHAGSLVSWSAGLTRSVQPSGFGVLVDALEANATARWQATERSSYFVVGRRVQTTSLFSIFTLGARTYESVTVGTFVRATEVWDVNAQVNWQRLSANATPFELPAVGRGFELVVSVARRFGRAKLM